ncbi:30756_t:CDS:2, partial [Gigaspora margarita]
MGNPDAYSVAQKLEVVSIDLAVIPGVLTRICQLLDVAINKPFNDNLHKEWHLWMAKGGCKTTKAGNLKRATLKNISNEIIIESFKTCGITNNLDTLENSDKENESENDDLVISVENSFSTDTTNIDDYISDSDDI